MDTLFQENMETDEVPSILGMPEEWAHYPLAELGKLHQRGWKYHKQLHIHALHLLQEKEKTDNEIHQLEQAIFALSGYMQQILPVSIDDSIVTLNLALECLEYDKGDTAKGLLVAIKNVLACYHAL